MSNFQDLLLLPPEQLFRSFFLPFIITFALFWGLLTILKIFNRRINIVLALSMTAAAWYGGVFTWFTEVAFSMTSNVVIIIFALLFIVGAAIWAIGRGKDVYYEQVPFAKSKKITKELAKHYKEYKKAKERGDEGRKRSELEIIRRLEMERDLED
jgi:hypothetical protein